MGGLKKAGTLDSSEVMYGTGYHDRVWQYDTGENSKSIIRIAGAETMNVCWLGSRTFDVKMAIDDLKELYEQKVKGENS